MSSPSKARRPVSISYSTQPNAQMSLRLSASRPFACSGDIYAAVPSRTPTPVIMAGDVIVGEAVTSAGRPRLPACASFARPKSSTFTTPSGVILMFEGFRSRWMIPCSWAASRASADLTRDRQGLIQRNRTTRDPIGQRVALDQFEDERVGLTAVLEPINRADVRVVQRGQHLRFALETGEAIRIAGEGVRQDLQRDVAIQLGIARAIHLAHAAGAEGGEDFVRAEARAGVEGQTM